MHVHLVFVAKYRRRVFTEASHTDLRTIFASVCEDAEQRAKLSLAQRAYVAHDPRWPEHRRKLAAAQEGRRMMLFDNEVAAIVALRRKGRTLSYIAEEIGRELRKRGIATGPIKADRRARRGRGFWRCFD
jgi:hypothetical protein